MMRHRLWVIALTAMAAVSYYVIGALLYLSSQQQWIHTAVDTAGAKITYAGMMQDYVRHYFGFCSMAYLAVIPLAVMTGLEGYAYMHKMQTVDFYESQPIKRSSRFWRIYANGMRIFLPIWGIATILGIGIGALYGGMSQMVALEMALELLRLAILFFGVYNVTILASAISKNVMVSALMTAILLGVEAAYRLLMAYLSSAYFTTYYVMINTDGTPNQSWVSSPIGNYYFGRTAAAYVQRAGIASKGVLVESIKSLWVSDAFSIVIGVVFLIAAFAAFERRPSEATGQGLVYRWLEGVTKIVIAIPLGALAGLVKESAFAENYESITWLTIALVILVIVVFCFLTEVLCNGNIRCFFKRPWQIPLALVLSFLFFLVYRQDWLGYDRYVPRESQIQDVTLIDESNYQAYYTEQSLQPMEDGATSYYGGDIYRDVYLSEGMHLKDIDAGMQLAHLGMAHQRSEAHGDSHDGGYSAVIMFHLKDGTQVARVLSIPYDVDEDLMNRLVGTDEYRSAMYQLDMLSALAENGARKLTANYNYGYNYSELGQNRDEIQGLLDAYAKDLHTLNFSKLKNKKLIGSLNFSAEATNYYNLSLSYPVLEDFTNTINYLDEHGAYHTSEIPTEVVVQMNVYGTVTNKDKSYYADLYYSEPELTEQMVPYLNIDMNYDWQRTDDNIYVSLDLVGEAEDGMVYDITAGGYTIAQDKLPASVLEEFQRSENSY